MEAVYDENYSGYSAETTELVTKIELESGRTDVDVTVYTLEQPDKAYSRQGYAEIP